MTDLVIWFGVWDDIIEQLGSDADAAERLRADTKALVRRDLTSLPQGDWDGLNHNTLSHSSLARRFAVIATEVRAFLDEGTMSPSIPSFGFRITLSSLRSRSTKLTYWPSSAAKHRPTEHPHQPLRPVHRRDTARGRGRAEPRYSQSRPVLGGADASERDGHPARLLRVSRPGPPTGNRKAK